MGRFINADGLISTGQGIVGNNMFAYCENNPVCRADFTGNCYYTVGGVWSHDNWEYIGNYERKPDPGYYQGTTFTGLDVYVGPNSNYSTPPGAVKVVDRRDTSFDENGKRNPNIQILNSYKITNRVDQVGVLAIISKYTITNKSKYEWKRTQLYLLIEWDMHNFFAFADQSARDVDFDNKEEGAGYIYFVGKAVHRFAEKIFAPFS